MIRAASCLALLASCHVVASTELVRPSKTERIRHPEGAIAQRPVMVLTDEARWRFIEPLECPTDEIVTPSRAREIVTKPNLATFVVGAIATSVGGIALVRGVSDENMANPFTFAALPLLAVGVPFAIGPFVGNRTELVELPAGDPVPRPGPSEPCGDRPLVATSVTLVTRGLEVHGKLDSNGVFAVSPFQLVDAFDLAHGPLEVAARIEATAGARTLETVFEGNAFGARAEAFLARADFDTRVEALRLVPGLAGGIVRVSLTTTVDGPAVRIVLPLKNDGPGPAWRVRARIVAPAAPAIDGRILYIGQLANGASITRELVIPVTPTAAGALRNANLDVALELRDAHGTAPATPVRFRGAVLVDAPR